MRKALIAAAQGGDVHAFNRLVRSYQRLAYNLALSRTGDMPKTRQMQPRTLLCLPFARSASFAAVRSRPGVLRIVTNECYDQLRRKQRRPEESLDDLGVEPDHSATFMDAQELPEEHALRQELSGMIQGELMKLPADQRMVVVLSDIQGYSYEEIAEITGVALGTVKSRLNRGRGRLRDLLLVHKELLPGDYRPMI